jgi:NAD(P)-dependent dehydrogenase (short-subunit alcohol dehydrogenase family)
LSRIWRRNAGICPGFTYKASEYGLETTFQANFCSTVVLTELMLPLMNKEGGRIIQQSSMSHADASKPVKWETIPWTEETFGGYNKDYAESKWLLTCYSAALNKRIASQGVASVCADPGASPGSPMWDQQTLMIRILARYVFRFLTKSISQASACAVALAVAPEVEGGGYYRSGVLVPPLRADTVDAGEWENGVTILRKVLPEDLRSCAVE